jgi:Fic family protein
MDFERSHPWLMFGLDLRRIGWTTWLALGEARSKCDHLSRVPLRPDTAQRLHLLYLAKGVRATTAIEGNTLTENQVLERLEGKLQLPKSKEYLGREIDNIKNACDQIFAAAVRMDDARVTPELVRNFNAMVLSGLELPDEVVPGTVRSYNVGVGTYRGAPYQDCDYLLGKLCGWLNEEWTDGRDELLRVPFAVIKAVIAHLYLAWIHPFGDGNGRTARLLEFHILVGAGVPTPAAHLLSNYYNETRTEYYRRLDRASKADDGAFTFLEYAIQGFVEELRNQLEPVWEQHFDIVWTNFIHETFRDKDSKADKRRRRLALTISSTKRLLKLHELTKMSPEIAEEYATLGRRTLMRDASELIEMGLLEKEGDAYRARTEVILAFLPMRREQRRQDQPSPTRRRRRGDKPDAAKPLE